MAILWEKRQGDVCYQVRSAGRTRRLYTDGVFHSQFRPQAAQAGGIWDLLWLPALLAPAGTLRRVLVLGVGGGTVIRQIRRYLAVETLTGVELNPIHLQVARRFFGVTPAMAELIEADALAWLEAYAGPPFDLIIDDLFGEKNGEPVRAVAANPRWCRLLCRNLSKEGLLVMNFVAAADLRNSALVAYRKLQDEFASRLRLTLPAYENAIGAFTRFPALARDLRNRIDALPGFADLPVKIWQIAPELDRETGRGQR